MFEATIQTIFITKTVTFNVEAVKFRLIGVSSVSSKTIDDKFKSTLNEIFFILFLVS